MQCFGQGTPFIPSQCVSSRNPITFTSNINRIVQAAARLCICPSCDGLHFGRDLITLYRLCRLINNKNDPSPFGYCIAAKLINPCYSTARDLQAVLDAEFGANVTDTSSYLEIACAQCNGCNENCQFPSSASTIDPPMITVFRVAG